MKRYIIVAGLLCMMLAGGIFAVYADCNAEPTEAADNITCSGVTEAGNWSADAGNDTVVNNGFFYSNINGGEGNDELTNNGQMGTMRGEGGNDIITNNDYIGTLEGGAGDDAIINNGMVGGFIVGEAGNDTIIINGAVAGTVYGDSPNTDISILNSNTLSNISDLDIIIINPMNNIPMNNDTVILQDGAVPLYSEQLQLNGGIGVDSLVFALTMTTPESYSEAAAAIAAASPNGGTITINGVTYSWVNFEQLINMLNQAYNTDDSNTGGTGDTGNTGDTGTDTPDVVTTTSSPVIITVNIPAAPAQQPSAPAVVPHIEDTRVNDEQRDFAPVAVFCESGTVQVYNPTGQMLFMGSHDAITAALDTANSTNANQFIAGAEGYGLWALMQTGELQVHADAGGYDYIFPASTCIG